MGVEGFAHVAGGGPGGSRVSVTLRNVLGIRVQLGWGSWPLATVMMKSFGPHLSLSRAFSLSPPPPLCLAFWGREEGGNTGRVQRYVLSQGLKWDRWKTTSFSRGEGGKALRHDCGQEEGVTESLELLILIKVRGTWPRCYRDNV